MALLEDRGGFACVVFSKATQVTESIYARNSSTVGYNRIGMLTNDSERAHYTPSDL